MSTVIFNTRSIARPSGADLLRGAVSAFNLSGSTQSEYSFAANPVEADIIATENDWDAVNGDLDATMAVAR